MINVHAIANSAIQGVNPDIPATIQISTGYAEGDDGLQVPSYDTMDAKIQKQPMSQRDMQHVDNLNLDGVYCSVYCYGNYWSVVRDRAKGGDLMNFNDPTSGIATEWLIVAAPEVWTGWCKLVLCQELT